MRTIELIESGDISQIRVASEIERIANMASSNEAQTFQESMIKKRASWQPFEPMLFLNKKGKAVGKLKNNGKKITITLSCRALNEDQEKALHEFVNNLVKTDEAENE